MKESNLDYIQIGTMFRLKDRRSNDLALGHIGHRGTLSRDVESSLLGFETTKFTIVLLLNLLRERAQAIQRRARDFEIGTRLD